eukprot:768018-Hanusia_phi.AAC.1
MRINDAFVNFRRNVVRYAELEKEREERGGGRGSERRDVGEEEKRWERRRGRRGGFREVYRVESPADPLELAVNELAIVSEEEWNEMGVLGNVDVVAPFSLRGIR